MSTKSLLSLVTAAFLLSGATLLHAQSAPRTISVVGTGNVDVVPDQVVVNYGIETMHVDLKQAIRENEKRMAELIRIMREAGIPEAQMQTNQMNLYPRYDWREGQQVFIGYNVNRNLEVTIGDLDRFDEILVKAVDAGANQVFQAAFMTSERDRLEAEARARAVTDARKKAEAIASQLGVTLGKVLAVREAPGGGGVVPMYAREEAMEASAMAPGQKTVSARLEVEFEML